MLRLAMVVTASAALLAASAGAASAAPPGAVTVDLHPIVRLAPDGALTGKAKVSCPPGHRVLEAPLTASQDDQTISGFSGIRGIRCTGKARWYPFRVASFDEPFHRGTARISTAVIVTDETSSDTLQGDDTGVFRVR